MISLTQIIKISSWSCRLKVNYSIVNQKYFSQAFQKINLMWIVSKEIRLLQVSFQPCWTMIVFWCEPYSNHMIFTVFMCWIVSKRIYLQDGNLMALQIFPFWHYATSYDISNLWDLRFTSYIRVEIKYIYVKCT